MVALASWSTGLAGAPASTAAACGWLRRASVPVVWAAIGCVHAYGAPAPVLLLAIALAAGLGAVILLVAEDDTQWSGLLAAAVLLTSPVLQPYWAAAHEGPHSGRILFLRTLVVVGGLVLLARLGSERSPQVD